MSAESSIYSALSGASGLTALVSTRIYPDAMPEETAMPAVVFARIGTDPTYNISGTLLCEDVEISIGAWAATRTSADAIGAQIVAALAAAGYQHSGQESGFDDEIGLYACTVRTEILVNP